MRKLFKAVLTVTFFSILTRALGFILRIILSRSLGAEMLGSYQVAMSVFGVLMTLVASGIPLVVSRSVAYNKSIGDEKSAFSSVSSGLVCALFISILSSLILIIFPNLLNLIFTENNSTSIVLFTLPGLIASAVYCVLRSSLWGDKHFFAISFTEFFEQIVRIILCLILFSTAIFPNLSLGEKASLSLSLACIASAILVVIIYFSLKQKLTSPKPMLKKIIKNSTPITTLRTVSSLVTSLISLIIPMRLMLYGYSSNEAMAQFGLAMGMAFPLIMIPGTLISSISVTLVPEISGKTDNIDDKSHLADINSLKSHIMLGLNTSILISMLFVPAFFVLGEPICEILFNSKEAGMYVRNASFIMLPMGISQISSSMLNAIGLEVKSLKNYAVGAIFLFISIYFLPKFLGTNALILGLGVMNIITAFMNINMLKKRSLVDNKYLKLLGLSLLFAFISILSGFLVYNLTQSLPVFISTAISGTVCTLFMFGLYYIFNLSGIKGFLILKRTKKKLHS